MTTIYLIRHAEAEGNLYRRSHGWYNSKITETGLRQISALEQRFSNVPVDAAYASDLQRTQTTAQAVVLPKHLTLHLNPALREISMGEWEERPFGELTYHYPEQAKLFFDCSPLWHPNGGETFQEVCDRMTAAVRSIAETHPNQTVTVFSHGVAIRCLQSALRGKHPSALPKLGNGGNTAVTRLEYDEGQFRILYENDVSHLPEELTALARRNRTNGAEPALEVWFRPLDMQTEAGTYFEARKDAWNDIHHSLFLFDGPGFVAEAREQWEADRRAVEAVMWQDKLIGLLQLATERYAEDDVGYVPFVYLNPDFRCRGIGVQLIGQAVCLYRALGRRRLRLRCAPDNFLAQRFYKRCGFVKIGDAPGTRVPLDLLEKEI